MMMKLYNSNTSFFVIIRFIIFITFHMLLLKIPRNAASGADSSSVFVAAHYAADYAAEYEEEREAEEQQNESTTTTKTECRRRHFSGQSSFVCVCSREYCDQLEPSWTEPHDDALMVYYISDKARRRMERREAKFEGEERRQDQKDKGSASSAEDDNDLLRIVVDPSAKFQTILGFGGAFSDAVGINLRSLSAPVRAQLLSAYFDPEKGLGYTLGRVPIASTDFSPREYSYADSDGDFAMANFTLAKEDLEDKIPFIKEARRLANGHLELIACPWSAPAWMKSNGRMSGSGQLRGPLEGPFYAAYAEYLKKFFEAYAEHGVDFRVLTIQNQPQRVPPDFPFQTMFMSNHTQREFAAHILAPLLKQSPHTANLKLIAFDDVRQYFLESLMEIFNPKSLWTEAESMICQFIQYLSESVPDFLVNGAKEWFSCSRLPSSSDVIDGIGVHWYTMDGHEVQDLFHEKFPDKMILSTEACNGFEALNEPPQLGNWTRGWLYGWDIVQNLRHWSNGWVDWNICLDIEGGPSWVQNNQLDAPIIVNAARDEFYKQPMFYFLAHFSHFIPPGSVRIGSHLVHGRSRLPDDTRHPIQHVAVLTPDGHRVLVVINSGPEQTKVRIEEEVGTGKEAQIMLEAESIMTAIWR